MRFTKRGSTNLQHPLMHAICDRPKNSLEKCSIWYLVEAILKLFFFRNLWHVENCAGECQQSIPFDFQNQYCCLLRFVLCFIKGARMEARFAWDYHVIGVIHHLNAFSLPSFFINLFSKTCNVNRANTENNAIRLWNIVA